MRMAHGQAAMEYLVTYGWALLALFFVIALLFGSGAFSVNNFSSPECTFQPDIPCSSYIIYRENGPTGDIQSVIAFNISNGLGFPINITNVTYTATGWGGPGVLVLVSPPLNVPMKSGDYEAFNYTITDPSSQPADKDFKTVFVQLTFYNCKVPANCTGPYVTSGRISSPIEKGQ